LFGEVVSSRSLNRIAQAMTRCLFEGNRLIDPGPGMVGMIKSGTAGRYLGDHMFETLRIGDYFGEEAAVFATPSLLRVRAIDPCEVFLVPAEALRDIPSVRWKLFESTTKRMRAMMEAGEHARVLIRWNDDYSIGVQRIDSHHRRLFEISNSVLDLMDRDCPAGEVTDSLGLLLDYARFHFGEEETLMVRYKYGDTSSHRAQHARLLAQLEEIRAAVASGIGYKKSEVLTFLQDWIVAHTLSDDRRAAAFLNSKGVY
jgi:hemerythrin